MTGVLLEVATYIARLRILWAADDRLLVLSGCGCNGVRLCRSGGLGIWGLWQVCFAGFAFEFAVVQFPGFGEIAVVASALHMVFPMHRLVALRLERPQFADLNMPGRFDAAQRLVGVGVARGGWLMGFFLTSAEEIAGYAVDDGQFAVIIRAVKHLIARAVVAVIGFYVALNVKGQVRVFAARVAREVVAINAKGQIAVFAARVTVAVIVGAYRAWLRDGLGVGFWFWIRD